MNFIISAIKNKIKPFFIIKVVSSLCTQLVSLYLVYLFVPEEYGQLALIITVGQLMYIMTTGWTDPTIVNLGTKEYAEKGSYKNIVIYRSIIVLFCFVIISILFFLLKEKVLDFIRDEKYYYLTYFLFIAYCLQSYFNQLLYPCGKNTLQSAFDLVYSVLLLAGVCLYFQTIERYVFVNLILNIIYGILILFIFLRFFKSDKISLKIKEFKKVLYFSVWQIFGVLGIYLTNLGVNYVFTIKQVDIAQIGLYNVAYKLFSEFTPIFAICVVIIPQWIFNSKNKVQLVNKIKNNTLIGVFLLFVAYMLVYFALEPILDVFNKLDYIEAIKYYLLLTPAFVFMAYGQIYQLVIMTTPAFKHIQYATLIQGILLVGLCIVLVEYLSIYGAIISVTFAFLGKAIYLLYIFNNKAKYLIINNNDYE